jgi:hypothetical protein
MKKDGISTLLNGHCKNMASRYQAGAARIRQQGNRRKRDPCRADYRGARLSSAWRGQSRVWSMTMPADCISA